MNIGIIGLGANAANMVQAAAGLNKDCNIQGVAADRLADAEAFAKEWKIGKVYDSYVDMLRDETIDFVYLDTPWEDHYTVLMECLKHNKGCLVESPICINQAQAREVLFKAEAKQIFIQEGNRVRFMPFVRMVREILQDGIIGTPRKLIATDYVGESKLGGKERKEERTLLDGLDALTSVVMFFGTNVSSLSSSSAESEHEIDVQYADGRYAKAVISYDVADADNVDNVDNVDNIDKKGCCKIYGSKGMLAYGSISNPEYIRVYDEQDNLVKEYDVPDQINGYEYELAAYINARKAGMSECVEMAHTETVRLLDWIDHLRLQKGMLYPSEKEEDLCCFEGNGVKKLMISPFRRYWLTCMDCIAYSLIDYGFSVPYTYYYNNCYTYGFTNEKTEKTKDEYQSVTPVTESYELVKSVTKDRQRVLLYEEEDPIGMIKAAIDEEKIVRVSVDLYYWIASGFNYMQTHLQHMSLVIGYDDIRRELIVFDTGYVGFTQYRVDYDRAVKAFQGNHHPSSIGVLDRDADVHMYTVEDVAIYAKKLVESIDDILENADRLWNFEGIPEEGTEDIFSILPTHMYSMENRANMNVFMFKNAFESDRIEGIFLCEEFRKLSQGYEECKNACIKIKLKRNKWKKMQEVKEKLLKLFVREKEVWTLYINKGVQLKMKQNFVEETPKML